MQAARHAHLAVFVACTLSISTALSAQAPQSRRVDRSGGKVAFILQDESGDQQMLDVEVRFPSATTMVVQSWFENHDEGRGFCGEAAMILRGSRDEPLWTAIAPGTCLGAKRGSVPKFNDTFTYDLPVGFLASVHSLEISAGFADRDEPGPPQAGECRAGDHGCGIRAAVQ